MSSSRLERILFFTVAVVWICLGGLFLTLIVAGCLFFHWPESTGSCEPTRPPVGLNFGFALVMMGVLGVVLGALSLVWRKK